MAGRKALSPRDRARAAQLGKIVREARDRLERTQEQVAQDAGVALSTLRRLEAGKTPEPGLFNAARIARALKIELSALAEIDRPNESNPAR